MEPRQPHRTTGGQEHFIDLCRVLGETTLITVTFNTTKKLIFDVRQPRMNDLLRGRIDKFSLDALMILATGTGLTAEWRVVKTGVNTGSLFDAIA